MTPSEFKPALKHIQGNHLLLHKVNYFLTCQLNKSMVAQIRHAIYSTSVCSSEKARYSRQDEQYRFITHWHRFTQDIPIKIQWSEVLIQYIYLFHYYYWAIIGEKINENGFQKTTLTLTRQSFSISQATQVLWGVMLGQLIRTHWQCWDGNGSSIWRELR